MNSPPRSAVLARIPSLDGLRALSIFLVVSFHSLQHYSAYHSVRFGWYALFNGTGGVCIFFEISGFLITSLLLQEHERRGSISLRGFYLRRAFRILPPLYFYIAVVVVLGLFGRLVLDRRDVLSSLFFFHNFVQNSQMWPLEHLWSISVEEQFYLVWPFLFVACLRKPGNAGRFAASVVPILILIISPVARVLLGRQTDPTLHRIGVSYLNFDFLMFGCLVALLQHTPRFEAMYRAATRVWWLPPAVMVVCSVLAARYENYFNLPLGYTLNGAAIAMFLLWCTRNPASVVGRILNWAPIAQIGVLSYSIYLWQTLFLHLGNDRIFGPLAWAGRFPLNWLGFLLLAAFSYHVIEQPSLRLRGWLIRGLRVYKDKRQADKTAAIRARGYRPIPAGRRSGCGGNGWILAGVHAPSGSFDCDWRMKPRQPPLRMTALILKSITELTRTCRCTLAQRRHCFSVCHSRRESAFAASHKPTHTTARRLGPSARP